MPGRIFKKVPGGYPTTLGYPLPTAPGLGVESAIADAAMHLATSGVTLYCCAMGMNECATRCGHFLIGNSYAG